VSNHPIDFDMTDRVEQFVGGCLEVVLAFPNGSFLIE
jgi:hypothetical protein